MSTTPNSAILVQTPKKGLVQIANADASGLKTIFTAGSNGSKVTSLELTSSDTSARVVTYGISRSSVFYPIATLSVPITAGQVDTTNPAVNALSSTYAPGLPLDNDGQPYILLESGDTLDIKALTTVTSGKTISALADGGHF